MRPSTMGTGRATAVYLGDEKIQFTHMRCGHVWVVDYAKKPAHKRLGGPTGCKMMASWWSAEKGGCISACPKCERAARKAAGPACGKGTGTYRCKRALGHRGPCGNRGA